MQVKSFVGRRSAFEVSVNGKLVTSKLKDGKFPDYDDVLQGIAFVINCCI